jgi:hypothetical protein
MHEREVEKAGEKGIKSSTNNERKEEKRQKITIAGDSDVH